MLTSAPQVQPARFAADAPKDQPSRPHPAASVEGSPTGDTRPPESFVKRASKAPI